MEKAIDFYSQAFSCAEGAFERSSASKNYGVAVFKLTAVLQQIGENRSVVESRFREAIEYLSRALKIGEDCKDEAWLSNLRVTYTECVEKAKTYLKNLPCKQRMKALEKHLSVMNNDLRKQESYQEIAVLALSVAADATIERDYGEAIEYFNEAFKIGEGCKDKAWLDNLVVIYTECIEQARSQLTDLPCKEKIIALEQYVSVMHDDSQKGQFYLEIASLTFTCAVEALVKRDYRSALGALHDCHRPIHECIRISEGSKEGISEVSVLENDVQFQLAMAESLQAIDQGDTLLKIAVDENEFIIMDLLYDVIDWYKNAVILAREVEIEMEAIALSRLGYVYERVLRMKSKSREYYTRSLQLAMSLQPRNFYAESWYQTCTEALQRYQKDSVVDEIAKKEEARSQHMKDLAKELADLNQANIGSGVADFMRYVYKTHPPKGSTHNLDEVELKKNTKKALLKAIQHYHPDKQDRKEYGEKWAVLCEEICKLLTPRYECYKFDSCEQKPSTSRRSRRKHKASKNEEAPKRE